MARTAPGPLIRRSDEVLNLEMPFGDLQEFVTPNERFYVRCHFPVPQIDVRSWSLQVSGAVKTPLQLSYDQLRALPSQTSMATVECAGNGRSFLEPKVKGVPWGIGAVGNAQWHGVFLRDILRDAGADFTAAEVILEGADKGAVKEAPGPSGEIHYARSLPFRKATADVLLAWEMNGAPLTAEHGFPLRAIVPGWFGMASVKWLQRVIVSRNAFAGYYQTIDYAYWERRDGLPMLRPLGEMQVKAQIARPTPGETIATGSEYRVHGAAWAGEAEVAAVDISCDRARTWSAAQLNGDAVRNAWRFWEFAWRTPATPGKCTLIARATDSAGRTQPEHRVVDYGTYVINHWLPIEVELR